MFFHKSLLLATASLSLFFCEFSFTSASPINVEQRGLQRQSVETSLDVRDDLILGRGHQRKRDLRFSDGDESHVDKSADARSDSGRLGKLDSRHGGVDLNIIGHPRLDRRDKCISDCPHAGDPNGGPDPGHPHVSKRDNGIDADSPEQISRPGWPRNGIPYPPWGHTHVVQRDHGLGWQGPGGTFRPGWPPRDIPPPPMTNCQEVGQRPPASSKIGRDSIEKRNDISHALRRRADGVSGDVSTSDTTIATSKPDLSKIGIGKGGAHRGVPRFHGGEAPLSSFPSPPSPPHHPPISSVGAVPDSVHDQNVRFSGPRPFERLPTRHLGQFEKRSPLQLSDDEGSLPDALHGAWNDSEHEVSSGSNPNSNVGGSGKNVDPLTTQLLQNPKQPYLRGCTRFGECNGAHELSEPADRIGETDSLVEEPPSFAPRHKQDLKHHSLELTRRYYGENGDISAREHEPKLLEARSKMMPTLFTRDHVDQTSQKPVLITSSVQHHPADIQVFGICTCNGRTEVQKPDTKVNCLSEFLNSAKKTAKCSFTASDKVTCVEERGKDDMSGGDNVWWQIAFCKRCQDAGGTSDPKFKCH